MTAFTALAERLNSRVMRLLGENLTVRVGAVDTVLTGIVSTVFDQQSTMLPFQQQRLEVDFVDTEFAATGAGQGSVLLRGDDTYRITDVTTDDGGMAHVTLSPKGVP